MKKNFCTFLISVLFPVSALEDSDLRHNQISQSPMQAIRRSPKFYIPCNSKGALLENLSETQLKVRGESQKKSDPSSSAITLEHPVSWMKRSPKFILLKRHSGISGTLLEKGSCNLSFSRHFISLLSNVPHNALGSKPESGNKSFFRVKAFEDLKSLDCPVSDEQPDSKPDPVVQNNRVRSIPTIVCRGSFIEICKNGNTGWKIVLPKNDARFHVFSAFGKNGSDIFLSFVSRYTETTIIQQFNEKIIALTIARKFGLALKVASLYNDIVSQVSRQKTQAVFGNLNESSEMVRRLSYLSKIQKEHPFYRCPAKFSELHDIRSFYWHYIMPEIE